jgi:hypothetical protein
LFLLSGIGVAGAGVALSQSVAGAWVLADVLVIAGFGLLGIGILMAVQNLLRRATETAEVARALRVPGPPAPIPTEAPGDATVGRVVLAHGLSQSSSPISSLSFALAAILAVGVAAGALDLLAQPTNRSATAVFYLAVFAVFVPVFLLFADAQRRIPGLWAATPSPKVSFHELGVEGPFYPYSAYRFDAGTAVIRSPWFKFVRIRLPAPNQIPWKLLTVTVARTRDGPNHDTAFLSLRRARLPIGFGGLQISEGSLGPEGTGDLRLGYGLAVALQKEELVRVLWTAGQAGSRLGAEFGQLTAVGQGAVKAAAIEGNSRFIRPLSGPWFVWLPSPGTESELAAWFL